MQSAKYSCVLMPYFSSLMSSNSLFWKSRNCQVKGPAFLTLDSFFFLIFAFVGPALTVPLAFSFLYLFFWLFLTFFNPLVTSKPLVNDDNRAAESTDFFSFVFSLAAGFTSSSGAFAGSAG